MEAVHIDTKLVRRLLEKQFPALADLSVQPVLPQGTDNALFRVGDHFVARLPRSERASVTLQKELQWLPRLAPLLPLLVPVPVADGMPAAGYPFTWSVYPWFDGEPGTMDRIGDRAEAAADLARFVSALQRVDPAGGPSPGEHNFFRGADLAIRDRVTRNAIMGLGRRIDTDAATAIWHAALRAPAWRNASVWIHGDLDPRNVLVRDGRLTAVIDWGGLAVGDPACDVMAAWKILPAEARGIFRDAVAVDEATWQRARGWVVSQAVIALDFYTVETNPTLVAEAAKWLSNVIADA